MASSAPSTSFVACCRRALTTQATNASSNRTLSYRRTRVASQHIPTSSAASSSSSVSPVRPARRFLHSSTASFEEQPVSSTSQSHPSQHDSPPAVGAHFYQPDPQQVTIHLNNLFDGLDPPMPAELAMRMVTHKGAISPNASAQKSQHNERLSFLGRRILRLYLSIFYHAHASLLASASPAASLTDAVLENALNTYALGQSIAPRWELGNNLQWRQMVGRDGRPTGYNRVAGQAVEAILGGIFRQYGAAIALQVFNSRILPFLDLPQQLRSPAMQLARLHGDLSATLRTTADDQAAAAETSSKSSRTSRKGNLARDSLATDSSSRSPSQSAAV